MIKAAQNNRGKFYLPAIIYFGAEHGACKQEILDLRWQDINFDFGERGIIRLYQTKNKREQVEFLMPRKKEVLLTWQKYLIRKRKNTKAFSLQTLCRKGF